MSAQSASATRRSTTAAEHDELVPSRYALAGDAVFQVGFEHPDWYNGFEHDPEEAARARVRLLRELAANRESLVATHLSTATSFVGYQAPGSTDRGRTREAMS